MRRDGVRAWALFRQRRNMVQAGQRMTLGDSKIGAKSRALLSTRFSICMSLILMILPSPGPGAHSKLMEYPRRLNHFKDSAPVAGSMKANMNLIKQKKGLDCRTTLSTTASSFDHPRTPPVRIDYVSKAQSSPAKLVSARPSEYQYLSPSRVSPTSAHDMVFEYM